MDCLSRRSVDLNAVCFTFAATAGSTWKGLKKRSKRYAEERLGRSEWHDAGYDAAAALLCWEYFKEMSKGEGPGMWGRSPTDAFPTFTRHPQDRKPLR